MEAQGERRYSSYSFMTSALDGVNGQRHASATFYPRRKDLRYPLDRKLGGPRAGLDTEARGKILSPLLGINMSETLVIFTRLRSANYQKTAIYTLAAATT
jgi:hypothetical protein